MAVGQVVIHDKIGERELYLTSYTQNSFQIKETNIHTWLLNYKKWQNRSHDGNDRNVWHQHLKTLRIDIDKFRHGKKCMS